MKKEFIKFFIFCPLPNEKKPIYDLLILKKKLQTIEKSFYSLDSQKQKVLFINNIILQIFASFFLLVRWKDGLNNIKKPLINYEEASWYDGEVWEKPLSLIKNDQLLSQIIFQRLFNKLLFFFLVSFAIIFLISFLLTHFG